MAYVDPPDATPSGTASSTDYNILTQDVRELKSVTDGVTFSAVSLTRGAHTSIANDTWTPVTWTAEVSDVGGWYSSGTDIVVPAGAIPAGYTTIALLVAPYGSNFDNASSTGARAARVLLNGSQVLAAWAGGTTDFDPVANSAGYIFDVAAGDVITMEVYQNSGGSLDAYQMKIILARYAPIA